MRNALTIVLFLLASLLFAETRITMTLDAHVEFDLSLSGYPPPLFPTYYFPTSASLINPQGIHLTISYQRIGSSHSANTMYLATRGSGDFSPSILLGQLYFAPEGEPLPPPGLQQPGGNWQAFTVLYQQIEQFTISGSGLRRFDRPQEYIFKAEDDDEAIDASTVLYYRLYGI